VITPDVTENAKPAGDHRYSAGRADAGPPGDRRDGLVEADRQFTVIEEPPEEHADDGTETPNRAIPQWAIDALLFGMPKYTSAGRIWGRMVSIAMSAQARGWTRNQFFNEVTKTERRKNAIGQTRLMQHKLWTQLVACSRDEGHALKQLDKAWAQAIENRMNEGFRTAEDLIADAVERAYAWDDRLTEGKDGLPDNEALVMSYVIAFIEKRKMSRVTCSAREVGEFVNIPKSTAHRALKGLTDKGFLMQFSKGTWSKNASKRKAAIYCLGDPYSLRYGGRGAPSAKAYAYKHFVAERDSEEWERLLHRGVCVWGQGLAPLSSAPTSGT
jgi:hypothetical protein